MSRVSDLQRRVQDLELDVELLVDRLDAATRVLDQLLTPREPIPPKTDAQLKAELHARDRVRLRSVKYPPGSHA